MKNNRKIVFVISLVVLILSVFVYSSMRQVSEKDLCVKTLEQSDVNSNSHVLLKDYDRENYSTLLIKVEGIHEPQQISSTNKATVVYYKFSKIAYVNNLNLNLDFDRCFSYHSNQYLYMSPSFSETPFEVGGVYVVGINDSQVNSYPTFGNFEVKDYDLSKTYQEQSDQVKKEIAQYSKRVEVRILRPVEEFYDK